MTIRRRPGQAPGLFFASAGATLVQADRKVELYADGPENLHVLAVAPDAVKIVRRARSAGWRPRELGPEDRLVLSEFGLNVAVRDLCAGTGLAPPA